MPIKPPIPVFASIVLLSALLAPAAMAADTAFTAAPSTTGSAVRDEPAVPLAPVGHRQPRASDIPAGASNADDAWLNDINRETDRKLHICSGC